MAVGLKTGGRDFKPGESGNPYGRPKENSTVKAILSASNDEFFNLASEFLSCSVAELKEKVENLNQSYMSWAISNYLYYSIKKKDFKSFEKILDRLIGKSPTFNEVKLIQDQVDKSKDKSFEDLSPEKLEKILEIIES